MYKNILRSGAPCYIENCSFYIQKDEAILTHVLDLLLQRKTKPIACHTYSYQELVETIQYYMSSKQEIKDKIKIIEALWTIIYSNNDADLYETNLMRRLTGLLYIDSKTMGNIKNEI